VIDLEIGRDPIEATVVDCVGGLPESARSLDGRSRRRWEP